MAQQPKPLDKMTKAQLVAALKKAYKRIAKLEAPRGYAIVSQSDVTVEASELAPVFPWQQVLNDTKGL